MSQQFYKLSNVGRHISIHGLIYLWLVCQANNGPADMLLPGIKL